MGFRNRSRFWVLSQALTNKENLTVKGTKLF